jgi:hypothetical protein
LAPAKPSTARLIDFFDRLLFTFSFVFFGSAFSGETDNFFNAEDLLPASLTLGITAATTTGDASVSSGSIASFGASVAIDFFEAAAITLISLGVIGSMTLTTLVAMVVSSIA